MRIVSLNAWGGAMFEPLRDWLPGADIDVLCAQEVTRTPGVGGWTRFEDAERSLPQRANLFEDIGTSLSAHQRSFVASDAGPVTLEDGRRLRQEFGLGTYVADSLTVVGQVAEFVHGSFCEHDDWPTGDRPRVAHGHRIVEPATGRSVSVVQLHGLRDPAGKADTPARLAQAHRVAAVVQAVRDDGDLTVVCGDLNLLPDSETFAVLGELGLVDLVGEADTRTSRYAKPLRHANYCLVSDPDVVRGFVAPATPEVSDHRPLILDI
ncbi:MAG: endonuclease/exonuclease/phosphatase family protein [Actinomycetota bacterium]